MICSGIFLIVHQLSNFLPECVKDYERNMRTSRYCIVDGRRRIEGVREVLIQLEFRGYQRRCFMHRCQLRACIINSICGGYKTFPLGLTETKLGALGRAGVTLNQETPPSLEPIRLFE